MVKAPGRHRQTLQIELNCKAQKAASSTTCVAVAVAKRYSRIGQSHDRARSIVSKSLRPTLLLQQQHITQEFANRV